MELIQDFKEFLELLNKNEVEYMVMEVMQLLCMATQD